MEFARMDERRPEWVHGSACPNTAIIAAPRDADWLRRHEEFVARAKAGAIEILFLGDSLTDWWREPDKGGPVWEHYFGEWKAANFGISADRTQHLLWRIRHGEVEGYSPKCVILSIGTNNTGLENDGRTARNTPEETIEGVILVVEELRRRLPEAVIILFALFPRGEKDSLNRQQIIHINKAISTLDDSRAVVFVDIGDRFLEGDREIRRELMPDLLHLSASGYRVWAEAIHQTLAMVSQWGRMSASEA